MCLGRQDAHFVSITLLNAGSKRWKAVIGWRFCRFYDIPPLIESILR